MLNIIQRRESQQIEEGRSLGENASIEPLIERCRYSGFIIQVHGYRFDKLGESAQARAVFKLAVDRRIQEQDFSGLIIHPASSELDPTSGPRVVFDSRGRVLMSWNT